jgi:hypothetical protein
MSTIRWRAMGSWEQLAKTNGAWRDCIRQAAKKRAQLVEMEKQGQDAEQLRLALDIIEQIVLTLGETRQLLLREFALASSQPEQFKSREAHTADARSDASSRLCSEGSHPP